MNFSKCYEPIQIFLYLDTFTFLFMRQVILFIQDPLILKNHFCPSPLPAALVKPPSLYSHRENIKQFCASMEIR